VDFKSSGSGVALVTTSKSTSKWFLSSVCQLMSLKMAFSYELAFTDITSERSLTSMGSHVGFQISGLSKFFKTTLVWANQYFRLLFRPRYLFNIL
jgi:hypothetical protein